MNFIRMKRKNKERVHGVFVEFHGVGVLMKGESGIGKSETAVELIMKGAKLIADDVIELERRGEVIYGRSPQITRHFIEIRGLGIINVKELFGISSVKDEDRVDLVIEFVRMKKGRKVERLGLEPRSINILGVNLPFHSIPVMPGRNLSALVEVAVRNYLCCKMGYNSSQKLSESVDRAIQKK